MNTVTRLHGSTPLKLGGRKFIFLAFLCAATTIHPGNLFAAGKSLPLPMRKLDENSKEYRLSVYLRGIHTRIDQIWNESDGKAWKDDLNAIALITIDREGHITSVGFERKSEDASFNDRILRVLVRANPFPPIPESLGQNELKLGFNFRPGVIN